MGAAFASAGRHPIVASELLTLFGLIPIRSVPVVRVDHPAGPVDLFTTHPSPPAIPNAIPPPGSAAPPAARTRTSAISNPPPETWTCGSTTPSSSPPGPGWLCTASLDPPADADGDGIATRRFADEPNPFAPACGPAPLPVRRPSDHVGSELDPACD